MSVKLNLGIIISCKAAESNLSVPSPTPTPPRGDTWVGGWLDGWGGEGSGLVDSRDRTRWTHPRNGVGREMMRRAGDDGKERE